MLNQSDSRSRGWSTRTGVAIALVVVTLAGCEVPDDTTGEVFEITETMVTIRGAYDMTLSDGAAEPTSAMIAQARAVCPGAQYMTATPSNLHQYDYTFLYKFFCPTGPVKAGG